MLLRPLLCVLAAICLLPDEGQWLPTQVRDMDWAALQKRGMGMTKDEFWHPDHGGVLSATVQINGCTASFVSNDGLLVTNHHCGFGAVSDLSTPEKNYLRDGFAAQGRSAELPAPGMVASVLKRIEDVTAVMHEAQAKATDDLDRWDITQRTTARLIADGEQKEPNTKCSVAAFLEGKEYHLYYRTQIRDVRLVYAPPRAIGEYGGETDNWEWPRHTGDFSFFRAYVAPNGDVHDFAPDNVPYHPDHVLKVATDGAKDGDLAIIMGYPGRTQRYKTSRGVATQQGYVYPHRLSVLTAALDVLEAASKTGEKEALAVAERIKSLANVQKNAAGMIFGLGHNGTAELKQREEAQFTQWVHDDAERTQRWGSVLADMLTADEEEASTIEQDTLIWFTRVLGDDMPLLMAMAQASLASAGDGKVPARLLAFLDSDTASNHFDLLQRPMMKVLFGEMATMSKSQQLPGTEACGDLDALFATTKMLDGTVRHDLFAQGHDAILASTDPLVVLARAIADESMAANLRARTRAGKMIDVGQRWIEAQEAFRGKAFYPDANSTLRVSIAEVGGYAPRDGVVYTAHTTVQGLLDKETGKEPFANPGALLAAAPNRMQSRFVDKGLGDVPVCFLTNGDTTGGNSGSPVINGKGELIGLNFDRVFEAVAGDFGWDAKRSRNVVVDIRYVLWIIESVCPCPALLKELVG